MSAAFNCSLNCTNPVSSTDQRVAAACGVKNALSAAIAPVCSDSDVLAGRWVKLYWDSDDDCGEGYDQLFWPGILKEKTCCSGSQQCNAPGATPPTIKCYGVKYNFSSGYCAGKTGSYTSCAVSQARADEKAASYAQATTKTSLFNVLSSTN